MSIKKIGLAGLLGIGLISGCDIDPKIERLEKANKYPQTEIEIKFDPLGIYGNRIVAEDGDGKGVYFVEYYGEFRRVKLVSRKSSCYSRIKEYKRLIGISNYRISCGHYPVWNNDLGILNPEVEKASEDFIKSYKNLATALRKQRLDNFVEVEGK